MTTKVDGLTGVDLIKDGTVVQQDLAANVAGNGPAFSANTVGGQTFTTGVASKMNMTTENFDTDNAYDEPNSRFTPQVAGYYQVNVTCAIQAATTLVNLGAYVRKNGVAPAQIYAFQVQPTAAVSCVISAAGLIYLNGTTDYIEPWVIASGTGALSALVATNTFSASLVRAA